MAANEALITEIKQRADYGRQQNKLDLTEKRFEE